MKTIGVVFGGRSAEHDVSILTAYIPIIQSLLKIGEYDVWPIYITRDGSWYADKEMNNLDFFRRKDWMAYLKKKNKIQLLFDDGLKIIWPGIRPKTVSIDLVFPAMHGTYGEDGSLMGLLRMANVPFVGCDIFASAVAMDKVLTKQVLSSEGVSVVPYVWFNKTEWLNEKEKCLEDAAKLKFPLFIKPVHLGSSIAISKAKDKSELENAIDVAFYYDDKVLVEKSIENLTEVTLPIIGNENLELAGIERPLNDSEFFNFEDKYISGGKKGGGADNKYSEIPAKISEKLSDEIKELGIKTYKILGCSGISRIDFLIDNDENKVYVNEVNTLPGSLFDHNWREVGVSETELVKKLIDFAEERFKESKDITYTFKSDILEALDLLSKVDGKKTK